MALAYFLAFLLPHVGNIFFHTRALFFMLVKVILYTICVTKNVKYYKQSLHLCGYRNTEYSFVVSIVNSKIQ